VLRELKPRDRADLLRLQRAHGNRDHIDAVAVAHAIDGVRPLGAP
jgi:hypothetical protein